MYYKSALVGAGVGRRRTTIVTIGAEGKRKTPKKSNSVRFVDRSLDSVDTESVQICERYYGVELSLVIAVARLRMRHHQGTRGCGMRLSQRL